MCPPPDASVYFTEVKVQMPQGGDMSSALVYDRSRSIEAFVPTSEVALKMVGQVKAYFRAKVILRGSEAEIQLLEQVGSDW